MRFRCFKIVIKITYRKSCSIYLNLNSENYIKHKPIRD